MRTNITWLLLAICIGFASCGKDENNCNCDLNLKYPDTGYFGDNILRIDSIDIQGTPYSNSYNPYYYSMCAEIPTGITVVILMKRITSTGTTTWAFDSSTRVGWSISNYESDGQIFMATGPVYCDLEIWFFETGSADIEIYYNGIETPSRIKTIYWD